MQPDEVRTLLSQRLGIWRHDNLPYSGRTANQESVMRVLAEIGYKTCVELGTAQGVYTEALCKHNPELRLTCVDTWESKKDSDNLKNRLSAKYPSNHFRMLRQASLDAIKDMPDRGLDLLFVNPKNGFDALIIDLIHWTPKVRYGGMVIGSNFCNYHRGGVIPAVEAYVRSHNIVPWYVTRLDVEPLWFWIN